MPRNQPSWFDREDARRRSRAGLAARTRNAASPPEAGGEASYLRIPVDAWALPGTYGGLRIPPNSWYVLTDTPVHPVPQEMTSYVTYPTIAQGVTGYVGGNYDAGAYPHTTWRSATPSLRVERVFPSNELRDAPSDDAWRYFYGDVEHEIRRMIGETRAGIDGSRWRGWVVRTVETRADVNGGWTVTVEAWPTSQELTVDVWGGWVDQQNAPIASPGRDLTDEELEERREARRVEEQAEAVRRHREEMLHRNRIRARELRGRVAARAAERLLRSVLDEEQNRTLTAYGGFEVRGSNGGVYWIAEGYSGNVYSLNEQRQRTASMCAHAMATMPDRDHMLAQCLMLQTDEPAFLQIANISHYSVPREGLRLPPPQRRGGIVPVQWWRADGVGA